MTDNVDGGGEDGEDGEDGEEDVCFLLVGEAWGEGL